MLRDLFCPMFEWHRSEVKKNVFHLLFLQKNEVNFFWRRSLLESSNKFYRVVFFRIIIYNTKNFISNLSPEHCFNVLMDLNIRTQHAYLTCRIKNNRVKHNYSFVIEFTKSNLKSVWNRSTVCSALSYSSLCCAISRAINAYNFNRHIQDFMIKKWIFSWFYLLEFTHQLLWWNR